jgi:regulatory factor X
LALTQQQVSDTPVPIDTALLEQSQVPAANAFPIDPALGGGAPPEHSPIHVDAPSLSPPVVEMAHFQESPPTLEDDSLEAEMQDDDVGRASGRSSKKTSAAPEDSDAELRRLAIENQDVELEELARRVRNDENSPSAEKTRQVYGLGWYLYLPLVMYRVY